MRRSIAMACGAAVALLVGSIAAIAWVTRAPETSSIRGTAPEPIVPPAPVAATEAPTSLTEPVPSPPQAIVVPGSGSDFGPAAKAERAAVAQTIRRPPHRPGRGGAAPVELFRGLESLQARIRHCAGGSAANARPAVLTLELESLEGKVAILDAAVSSRGGATERTIACAQRELLGQEIPVSMATPGVHFKLPFTLRL